MSRKTLFIAIVVSLGGFLFGFDAGIISGVMNFATPVFDLTKMEEGWVISSPLFASMFAMLLSAKWSDKFGRKNILLVVAIMYAASALLSALAISYEMLYLARMLGGLAFGAALVVAPTYIAEISTGKSRGTLVSVQQLNIVLGYFMAFVSNYFFNDAMADSNFLTKGNVWQWMLGVELLPAVLYLILLFLVPKSPRWLYNQGRKEEGQKVLAGLYGEHEAVKVEQDVVASIEQATKEKGDKPKIGELLIPSLRLVLIIGLVIGVLQQATGINAVYFYATSIFKQIGVGDDAAFEIGMILGLIPVVFTIISMMIIDKMGRRPLFNVGLGGIAVSMLLCAFSFSQATYELPTDFKFGAIAGIEAKLSATGADAPGEKKRAELEEQLADLKVAEPKIVAIAGTVYDSDVAFKSAAKEVIGDDVFGDQEGAIIAASVSMNGNLALIGILGFIACFAFSLGPVMWVMLSEMYPNRYRGLAIGFIGFVNGFTSWSVSQMFAWELDVLGAATSFLIFGVIATVGLIFTIKLLPETKGKTLEELEKELIKA